MTDSRKVRLTSAQVQQLNDVVTNTRITRGKNEGKRKESNFPIGHLDMRSFNGLIYGKLVEISEYNCNECFATELGYAVWKQNR
ncbi:hypothetical protein [Vibrio owensii]|uniref:hypothetical protein n=1 Tax=Vibrio owensii TaxID=696485 RepID=UPI003CC67262